MVDLSKKEAQTLVFLLNKEILSLEKLKDKVESTSISYCLVQNAINNLKKTQQKIGNKL